jgi:hypothetical protein
VLAQRGARAVVYPGRAWILLLVAVLTLGSLTIAALAGRPRLGFALAGLLAVAWLAYALRLTRLSPAGPGGDGPTPPGGAGVREPRRPLPHAPAGAAVRAIDDEQPRRGAAAIA